MSQFDELKDLIKQGKVILFVGAGVSATLGLPTWSKLIAHLANELGYESRLFEKYGDSISLAEYYVLTKGRIGELRSWMDTNWNVKKKVLKKSKVYEYIIRMKFPIIYTTNYDHCLERAFKLKGKSYKRIVDVGDFVGINTKQTQIVKFHGDMISDSSIVLTESSYFERLEFESPLDIKLKADILGKSVLFIGYSLSDINIRLLLYKIDKLWQTSSYKYNKPKSYIFLSKPNPIQEAILQRRGIETIVGKKPDEKESLEKFLKKLSQK